jgi:DNA-directed RNA polymerase subunit beta'
MVHEKTEELKRKILSFIKSNNPIVGGDKSLYFENLSVTDPENLNDISKHFEMKYSGTGSLVGYVRGKIVVKNKNGKVVAQGKDSNLIPVYYMTDRNTYLVNGVEKNILKQMQLKPGSYTEKHIDKQTIRTNLMFDNSKKDTRYMPKIEMEFDPLDLTFKVKIGDKGVNGIGFLRELGFTDPEIARAIGNNSVSDTLFKSARSTKGVREIYTYIVGKAPTETTPEKVRAELLKFMSENGTFGKIGGEVIKANLGLNSNVLTKDVLLRSVQKTFAVGRLDEEQDDKDDLRFKRILDDNDLMLERVEKDFEIFKEKVKKTLENNPEIKTTDIRGLLKLGDSVDKFMSESPLVQSSEQINPLFIASINNRVTQMGGSGGISEKQTMNTKKPRNLKGMGINRLDPVETPESGKIGLIEHLTSSAKLQDGVVYIPVLKVKDGVATDTASNVVELDPHTEYDKKVAFYDSRVIQKEGNKIHFTKDRVPARYKGKIEDIHVSEIDYIDKSPQNLFNYTANSIPFVNHDDGNRALMGTNMQKQAIMLKNREIPLVMSKSEDNKTYEEVIGEKYGRPVKSNVAGTVSKITEHEIQVKDDDGKTHTHPYYNYFPLNQSFIHNEVLVKPGDKVKKGQMVAEGWQTKEGKLSLGLNARVGYMPYKGYNYEDGIVISRSFAQKMEAEEIYDKEIDIREDWVGGKNSNAQNEFKAYTTKGEIFQRLDKDGIIKVGEHVKPGDILVGYLKPQKQGELHGVEDILNLATDSSKFRYESATIEPNSFVEGDVKRITIVDKPENGVKQRIVISILSSKPLKIGDKVSGKHGNKGTITKILPDEEMPVTQDKKPLDLIFSSLAVPSRKNLGQLLEIGAGLVAEKTGKTFVVNNFDHTEKDRVLSGLKEIGYPDGKMKVTLKEKLDDGTIKDIEADNPVTVGNMYIMKLKHKVDDKMQARSNLETAPQSINFMPSKQIGQAQGEKHNPQRLGEMEQRALQAHGAVWNIFENSTIKADGGGDAATRHAIFNAIATGKLDGLDVPGTPGTVHVLADSLKVLGLNVKPINNGKAAKSFDNAFNSVSITPIKSAEMMKMIGSGKEVKEPYLYDSKTNKDTPRPGGLADPDIFGKEGDEDFRKQWGYIKLTTPLPNPLFLHQASFNPYSILTGIKKDKLVSLASGKNVMIADPKLVAANKAEREELIENMTAAGIKVGDIIDVVKAQQLVEKHGELPWKTGGESIQHLLDHVDLEEELKKVKKDLKEAKGKNIATANKKYRALLSLKANGLEPSDLMLHYVPVAPLYLRPTIQQDEGYVVNDLDKLYGNIIKSNSTMSKRYENGTNLREDADPDIAAKDAGTLYSHLSNLVGTTTFIDSKKKREVHGINARITGKKGYVRGSLLSKRVDFSGRSVIGVDPELNINEVAIPLEMAKTIYKPFIKKELMRKGRAQNLSEADRMLERKNDPDVVKTINEISEERPVILNRQPSLHKFSIQAFKPVVKETQDGEVVRNIQLNPLVVTGFNADYDGDTMAVHVPVTEKARKEALDLMNPSNNLINPTNGQMIVEVRHEMALGIYYLTMNFNKAEGQTQSFGNYLDLRKAYTEGKVTARGKVSLDGFNGTAGQAMVNFSFPPKYRKLVKPIAWTTKDISATLMEMYADCEKTNGRAISKMEISATIDRLKKLGFEAATRSGISIGVTDFRKMEDTDALFKKHVEEAKKEHKDPYTAQIIGWGRAEKEIEDKIKSGKVLGEENPLNIMMVSGARANAGQIRRMMTSVGVGMDVNNTLRAPVKNSLLDGLSPSEYWTHSYDSRKGMFDRSVSTRDPGVLARDVWSAIQDVIIKEKDCKTKDGIILNKNNTSMVGRFTAETVMGEKGIIIERNQPITEEIRNKIYADKGVNEVRVRSPLKCKTVGGVCQKCYGFMPGTISTPKTGSAIGVIASQSLGEPVTQMTLNTFHSGGINSTATLGLPRINELLDIKSSKLNEAVLARVTGKVTDIIQGVRGTFDIVKINGMAHKVPHLQNGDNQKLKVSKGDSVFKGDFLTFGDVADLSSGNPLITNADPKDLFKLKEEEFGQDVALDYTKDYLTRSMEATFDQSIGSGKIDSRHLEVIVGKLASKVTIEDPGDSNFIKGDSADKNLVDEWNAINANSLSGNRVPLANAGKIVGRMSGETYKDSKGNIIVAKGEMFTRSNLPQLMMGKVRDVRVNMRPIKYRAEINSKSTVIPKGHQNWVSNLGHENIYEQLARGATLGQVSNIDDPRSRLIMGKLLNIGEGYQSQEKEVAKPTLFSTISKLFSKKD